MVTIVATDLNVDDKYAEKVCLLVVSTMHYEDYIHMSNFRRFWLCLWESLKAYVGLRLHLQTVVLNTVHVATKLRELGLNNLDALRGKSFELDVTQDLKSSLLKFLGISENELPEPLEIANDETDDY